MHKFKTHDFYFAFKSKKLIIIIAIEIIKHNHNICNG